MKQSRSKDSPVQAKFGPRTQAWRINLNYSTIGVNDDIDRELRSLFREKSFRLALSHALDRHAIGQSIARGPFAYPTREGF